MTKNNTMYYFLNFLPVLIGLLLILGLTGNHKILT